MSVMRVLPVLVWQCLEQSVCETYYSPTTAYDPDPVFRLFSSVNLLVTAVALVFDFHDKNWPTGWRPFPILFVSIGK
jgi:hypothetical protein